MKKAYDVIVLGLGGMGSAAAQHLAARGRRVLGLERFSPAHALGSSHGGSRIVRQSYFEGPEYVPLLLRAYELWERLEVDADAELLTLTGGLYLGPAASTTVAGSLRSALAWDLPHELLDAAEIRSRFPTLHPDDDLVGLYERRAGFVRPEATVAAQLALAERLGADLCFEEPAVSWSAGSGGVEVVTATNRYTAGKLVVTPGAWAPEVLADLGLPLRVQRQMQFWFQPRGGVDPYLPDRHPIYIWEDRAGVEIYGFPAIDGPEGGAKIAFFGKADDTTPEALDREVHPDEIAAMAARAGTDLPALPHQFLKGAACMFTTTPDGHFVIAAHPAHPEVTIACGFSGHGFKFVPVVGEILADLAIEGSTRHPIGLFDPTRPSLLDAKAAS